MGQARGAAVYAAAFLGAMEKTGVTDAMMAEFASLVHQVLDRFPSFEAALGSLRIGEEEKAALLDRVLGPQLSPPLMTFLKVVNRHGRLSFLREILRQARQQLNERRGVVDVQVTTAVALRSELAQQISHVLQTASGRRINLLQAVKPDVLGGLIVRVGDKVFDGSVMNRLWRLRAETLEKTVRQMRCRRALRGRGMIRGSSHEIQC